MKGERPKVKMRIEEIAMPEDKWELFDSILEVHKKVGIERCLASGVIMSTGIRGVMEAIFDNVATKDFENVNLEDLIKKAQKLQGDLDITV